jgi:CheY-like chemotaxis protein/HPt (histidine-containing phosphotransfer) domain-containing protein
MMSGQIGVESVAGRGSTFWFEVPLMVQIGKESVLFKDISPQTGSIPLAPFRPAAVTPAPAAVTENSAATILLVEDNAEIRMTVLAMLKKLGFEGEAVQNGRQAVEAIGRRHYDLIFMDCQMPIMDGYEATRRIREAERRDGIGQNGRSAMPIVAMTASALAGDRERCISEGMDDYLCKPFTLDTLQDFLDRFVGRQAAHDDTRPERQRSAQEASAPMTVRPSGTTVPVIDYDALRRIGALGSGSSSDLLSRVVRSYLDAAPDLIGALRQAIDDDNAEAISATAHRLKGSSAQLGIERVAGLCGDLEKIAKGNGNGNGEAPAALLRELEEEFGRVEADLEKECLRIAS